MGRWVGGWVDRCAGELVGGGGGQVSEASGGRRDEKSGRVSQGVLDEKHFRNVTPEGWGLTKQTWQKDGRSFELAGI